MKPEKTVLVGVSGGADSLCLLDICMQARLPVIVAHFNHHLRPEAEAEARFVESFAAARQAPFVIGDGNVLSYAQQGNLSIEEAARILRYQFLFAQAAQWDAQAVVVAHHADDQVETVLMHILRGAGLDGLVGMSEWFLPNPWSASIPVVRPLLSIWRNEIQSYCHDHGLVPVDDSSNRDINFRRNRIRQELIPLLEQYNPRLKQALWRMSKTLEADLEAMEQLTQDTWQACLARIGDGFVTLWQDQLISQPVGIQRRLLRHAAAVIGRNDINFDILERSIRAINQPMSHQWLDFGRGLCLFWESGRVWLAAWEAELPTDDWPQADLAEGEVLPLTTPSTVPLLHGWQLTVEELPGDIAWPLAQNNTDAYQAFITASLSEQSLGLRIRQRGDIFHPLGLDAHTQKLSDLMVNVKLPRRARRKWPLVCAGKMVVWVPGYAVSHNARLTREVQHAIHLRLTKPLILILG